MSTLQTLKRMQTKKLRSLIRQVRAKRRLHRFIPHEDQFIASAAAAIIRQRRSR